MNLNDQAFRIHGIVIDNQSSLGLKGLRVEAWDKGFLFDDAVGFAETDEWGAFEIQLDKNRFLKFFERNPALYFKVFHRDACIGNTENSIIWNQKSGNAPVRILIEKSIDEKSSCLPPQPHQCDSEPTSPDHFIRGRLVDNHQAGLSQYTIVVSEYDLHGAIRIDTAATSKYGSFEFEFAYSKKLQKNDNKTGPDLAFQVLDPNGATVEVKSIFSLDGEQETAVSRISENQQAPIVLMNATANLTLKIVIDLQQQPKHQATEFEQLIARLNPFMGKTDFADLKEDETNFQISFLSKESDVEKLKIEQLRDAFKHERNSNGIPAWVFYELILHTIPLTNLASMAVDKIIEILKPGRPQCEQHSTEAIANKLLQYSKDQIIQTQVDNLKSSVGDLLQPILASEEKLNAFLEAYTRHEGDTESFWKTMSQHKDFHEEVPKIQLNLQLARLTLNNKGLIQALQREGVKNAKQLVDITADNWEALALKHKEGIPPHITEKDDQKRAAIYARELQALVELAFPTAVIKKNIQQAEVRTFLDRNPEFDFTRTPVESYLQEQKEQAFHGIRNIEAVKVQLRKTQRLYSITANVTDMNILMDMQYDSAHQIAKLTPEDFSRSLSDKIPKENAYIYHAKALAISDTTAMVYHQFRDLGIAPSFKATEHYYLKKADVPIGDTPAVAPGHGTAPSNPTNRAEPDWRNLFGSLDMCACPHCRSVYSPAAYFVDLLHILLGQHKGAPRNELFRRRPDLRYLKLSCEHAENLIPYIDLVNEILEIYVAHEFVGGTAAEAAAAEASAQAHAKSFTIDTSNFASTDLIANPQHPNEESTKDASAAYELIKKASFPLSLPFDMDLEVARQFLLEQHSSRFEVMKTFGNASSNATLAENLRISELEFKILTLKELDGLTAAGIDEIKHLWGEDLVIPPGKSLGEVLAKVDEFLARTAIAYTDLIDLLNTQFLNPNFPINLYLQSLTETERKNWLTANPNEAAKALKVIELGGDPKDPCNLSKTQITHLDRQFLTDTELSLFNRFIRLWRKLGCKIKELDGLLTALEAKDITPQVILDLSLLWQVQQYLGISFERLPVLIGNIPAAGKDSLFAKLFLNKAILQIDQIFKLNVVQDELDNNVDPLEKHIPAILAAFSIPEEDLNRIAEYVKLDLATDLLNLANLSKLYRYVLFAKGLRMKIKDLITWLNFISLTPWGTAGDLLNTCKHLKKLQHYGFKAADFGYIFRDERASGHTLPPKTELITQSAKVLREGLVKIRQEHTLSDGDAAADFLKIKLGILLESDEVSRVIGILDETNTRDPFNYLLTPKVLDQYKKILKNYLTPADIAGLAALTDISQRLKTYWAYIEKKLLPVLRETFVQQHLIAEFKSEADTVTLMLQETRLLQVFLDVEIETPKHTQDYIEYYILMHKFTWLSGKLKLSGKELLHFENNPNFGNFNWKKFDFALWLRIADYAALRNSLPPAEINLLTIFDTASKGGDITKAISEVTAWDKVNVDYFVAKHTSADFLNEIALIKLQEKIAISEKIGVSIEKLETWTTDSVIDEQSQDIKRTLKAKYSEDAWIEVSTTVHNRLRMQLRDALVAFLLQKPKIKSIGLKEPNDLFAYFLIDVEMSACMLTSRLVQANASIQLFVQRCLLNLEKPNKITPDMIDAKQWDWMKNYPVWEANRKVFLYPENWIEPELRDNKSPFFKELESELLQAELTDEIAEQKLKNYLEKLDEVARLDICGIYQDDGAQELHVFGRSFNTPPQYFYRKLDQKTQVWTAWERVPLDIQSNENGDSAGVHLMPVVWNRRLYLFWPIFIEKTDKVKNEEDQKRHERWEKEVSREEKQNIDDSNSEEPNQSAPPINIPPIPPYIPINFSYNVDNSIKQSNPLPVEPTVSTWAYYEVQIAWSEYRENRWLNKKASHSFIRTPSFKTGSIETWQYRFSLHLGPTLKIQLHQPFILNLLSLIGEYQFNCNDKVRVLSTDYGTKLSHLKVIEPVSMAFYQSFLPTAPNMGAMPLALTSRWKKEPLEILGNSEKDYQLLFPADYDFPLDVPTDFTYQDYKRNYHVQVWTDSDWSSFFTKPELTDFYFFKTSTKKELPLWQPKTLYEEHSSDAINPLVGSKQLSISTMLQIRSSPVLKKDVSLEEPKLSSALNAGLYFSPKRIFKFNPFFHAYVCYFMEALNKGGIDGLLTLQNQQLSDIKIVTASAPGGIFGQPILTMDFTNNFKKIYLPDPFNVATPYPVEEVDFSTSGAFSDYNWEVFFHVPLLIANRLSQNHRFEEARRWYHFIFNPTTNENLSSSARFWQVIPFRNTAEDTLEALMMQLHKKLPGDSTRKELENAISAWRNNPFNPHLIARMRLIAYQKNVVMKYLDNLIAWGDYLFRQDTRESINEATQIYILAAEICGKYQQEIPNRVKHVTKNYDELEKGLDAFSNALVDLETMFPFYNIDPALPGTSGAGSILGTTVKTLYFCLPDNEKLKGYWDTIADRLFKIRHCQNIEGIERQLALFEPPIDPALLVRAVAGGVDISSVLADLNSPMPYYRFNYIVQKALEICAELKSLGNSLLSALEKKDGEALAMMRSQHEVMLLNLVKTIRKLQVTEARQNKEGLERTRTVIEHRAEYYAQLIEEGLNSSEKESQTLSAVSMMLSTTGQYFHTAAAAAQAAPDTEAGTGSGTCSGPTTNLRISGGDKTAKALDAFGNYFQMLSTMTNFAASSAQTNAGNQRRATDWNFQKELAKKELEQIDKQILAAEIRESIAAQEQSNHEQQLDNARQVEEFLRSKYTQDELYGWMIGQLSSIFFQCYQLAYDLAKKAEKTYRHELGLKTSSFIQFGIWDSFRKGLLSGERLYLSLKQMEKSYMDQNRREYELTKHISLLQHKPLDLIKLRETGSCTVELPESLFDVDYPGHYMRRIKNVRVTIPCIVGPHTSVNCTLTLLKSKTRISAIDAGTYADDMETENPRVVTNFSALESIATSSAQNDSGMFELNFRDERYLPFEGSGAISLWRIELPKDFHQFDYETISDVILHINYTSRQGGNLLQDAAIKGLKELLKTEAKKPQARLFSLRHEFPSEWHRLLSVAATNGGHIQAFPLAKHRFPFVFQGSSITINNVELLGLPKGKDKSAPAPVLNLTLVNPDDIDVTMKKSTDIGSLVRIETTANVDIEVKHLGDTKKEADWTIKVDKANVPLCLERLDDILVLCHYSVVV